MIKADPGIYLVELIKDKSAVNTGTPKKRRVLKGKILDVGSNRSHDQGGDLKAERKVGDIIWFFSYADEDADSFEHEGKTYHTVIFNDARAHMQGGKTDVGAGGSPNGAGGGTYSGPAKIYDN